MLFVVIMVLGVALTIMPAQAQSGSRVLVNIPFDFSVGTTTLKAGTYTVKQLEPDILAFSSEDGREHKFALTFPADPDRQSQEPRLVFLRYGSEAFLNKVVFSSDDCHELPESSRERELIKTQAADAELSLLIHPAS
jgi:hypothetical protein